MTTQDNKQAQDDKVEIRFSFLLFDFPLSLSFARSLAYYIYTGGRGEPARAPSPSL